MKREVEVSINGLHQAEEENQIEVSYQGQYYLKDGKHYIFYEEVSEEGEKIKNRIKIQEQVVEVTKKGNQVSKMIFDVSKSNVTSYHTPYGELQMGIHARRIHLEEHADRLWVEVEYALEINGQHMSECKVEISVCPAKLSVKKQDA